MQDISIDQLGPEMKEALATAEATMPTAYSPYSHFCVGAALVTTEGEIISGSNVENAAYGSSICAERAALLRANAMGKRRFTCIAIIGKPENGKIEDPIAPCGACRQMLLEASEISGNDLVVIMSNSEKTRIVTSTIHELLPMAFKPKHVGKKLKHYSKSHNQ